MCLKQDSSMNKYYEREIGYNVYEIEEKNKT